MYKHIYRNHFQLCAIVVYKEMFGIHLYLSFAAPCTEPKLIGRCRAAIERYYYNQEKSECEMFLFGGCGANDNNFKDKESCENKCVTAAANKCSDVMCTMFCEDGFVKNEQGCDICKCKTPCDVSCSTYRYFLTILKYQINVYLNDNW